MFRQILPSSARTNGRTNLSSRPPKRLKSWIKSEVRPTGRSPELRRTRDRDGNRDVDRAHLNYEIRKTRGTRSHRGASFSSPLAFLFEFSARFLVARSRVRIPQARRGETIARPAREKIDTAIRMNANEVSRNARGRVFAERCCPRLRLVFRENLSFFFFFFCFGRISRVAPESDPASMDYIMNSI